MKTNLKFRAAALLLLPALLLSGCGNSKPIEQIQTTDTAVTTAGTTQTFGTTDLPESSLPQTLGTTEATSAPTSTEDTQPATADTAETTGDTTADTTTGVPTPISVTLNPYDISEEYADLYGEAFLTVWGDMADAFLNYEPDFSCPDENTFLQLLGCLDYCMPYFSADAALSYESFDAETQTVTIHYYSADKETHNAAYGAFCDCVTLLLENCVYPGEPTLLTALGVYRNFCTRTDYAYSDDSTGVYATLTQGTGDAFGISGALAYVLRQAGIPANVCSGVTADGRNTHQWTVFQIDGKWFYADPTFEIGETAGSGLSYFGIHNAERAEAGYPASTLTIGVTGAVSAQNYNVNHDDFGDFRGVTSFLINRERRELVVSVDDITYTAIPFDTL